MNHLPVSPADDGRSLVQLIHGPAADPLDRDDLAEIAADIVRDWRRLAADAGAALGREVTADELRQLIDELHRIGSAANYARAWEAGLLRMVPTPEGVVYVPAEGAA